MAYVISKACTKCGACLPECPTGSIIDGAEQFYIDADTCRDHAACVNVCPVDAITLRPVQAPSRGNKPEREDGDEEEEG